MGDWAQWAVLLSQVILAGVVQVSASSLEPGWKGESQDGIDHTGASAGMARMAKSWLSSFLGRLVGLCMLYSGLQETQIRSCQFS